MPFNKHAIVIGVGPGLGAALVQKCVGEGMKVSAGARDRDRLRKLLDERGLHEAPALECDVSDPASVHSAFNDAIADAGVPDLVIFNASGYARGSILFTGATASLRGSANFAPFAIAKFGLRALAQSMARELGPKGIHVAHVVIDGQIGAVEGDAKLNPADIAEAYWSLYRQPRSAWTLEADLRTWVEKF